MREIDHYLPARNNQTILFDSEYRAGTPLSLTTNETLAKYATPKILVIGCGGAGNNCINRLQRMGIHGAKTIAINTDKQHLDMIEADVKVLIGRSITQGLGAGGYPEIGERCALQSENVLDEILEGANLVFITAGMGGGTGTGSAPVVARVAKKHGAIVIGVATTPFTVERARIKKAMSGLLQFREEADSVIVLDNNRLLSLYPHLPVNKAFSKMDVLISEIVKGITETITQPSLINLDFADVKTIMSLGGVAMLMYSETDNLDPDEIVDITLNHPMLDINYKGGTGALIHITGGTDLTLKTIEDVTKGLTKDLDKRANIIIGARVDKDLIGQIRVMSIITGVHSPNILAPSSSKANKPPLPSYEKYPTLTSKFEIPHMFMTTREEVKGKSSMKKSDEDTYDET